jgi:cytochrome P450
MIAKSLPVHEGSPDLVSLMRHDLLGFVGAATEAARRAGGMLSVPLPIPLVGRYLPPITVVTSYPAAKAILTDRTGAIGKGATVRILRRAMKVPGIIGESGVAWKRQSDIIRRFFNLQAVKAYEAMMRAEFDAWLGGLEDGQTIDLREHLSRIAFVVLLKSVFSVDQVDEEVVRDLPEALPGIVHISIELVYDPLLPLLALFDARKAGKIKAWRAELARYNATIDRFVMAEFERHSRPGAPEDVVTAMLRAVQRGEMTEHELRANTIQLLSAGHETTSSSLSFLLTELSQENPDFIERFYADVAAHASAQTFKGSDAGRYMNDVLARYVATPFVPRGAERRFVCEGYEIPRGSQIMILLGAVLEDARSAAHAGGRGVTHFGGGERVCVGMQYAEQEMFTLLRVIASSGTLFRSSERPRKTLVAGVLTPAGPGVERVVVQRGARRAIAGATTS